ncbi:hypothetical protein AB670_03846 [Chryseobacterium sp. MOF25P]|uniref:hypothetical protein n=1 Tax=unclassified Chryseobacterium TaxID=2593645 RepID=UPI0008049D66|nr:MULTISPECIES: hypothetical protein [unclassified Chryseobacterium]OBW39803.1 hypothetical protein AB670_03846 [Chryseobacterium sp. MOF25P]OBW44965.1 hypothetical protein AB671_02985 [Chryseobacterium sp. BGARF1]
MNKLLLILIVFLMSCKEEKSFADDIVLNFPKNEKLTFQNFNDDMNEMGTSLIYIGKDTSVINVKYYKYIFPPPPAPPKINENTEENIQVRKRFEDSINFIYRPFFNLEAIQIKETEEDLYETINNQTTQIIVKEKDTIPLYARNYETKEVKRYKAFPVFIKNISSKTLRIPIEAQAVGLYVLNDKKFQYIRNSDYLICGMGSPKNPYFELKPNEILIYSFPHLKKGKKRKAKISFFKATSKEFETSINEEIIKKQRNTHFLQ